MAAANFTHMSAPWTTALASVAEQLNGNRIEWMLLGSAATALRGAAIVPGDIDIAIHSAATVSFDPPIVLFVLFCAYGLSGYVLWLVRRRMRSPISG